MLSQWNDPQLDLAATDLPTEKSSSPSRLSPNHRRKANGDLSPPPPRVPRSHRTQNDHSTQEIHWLLAPKPLPPRRRKEEAASDVAVTPDPSGPRASSRGGQRSTCLRVPSKRGWQDIVWRRVSSCCVSVPRKPRDNGLRSTLACMYGFGTHPSGERKGDLWGFHGADKIPTPGTDLGSILPSLGQMPEVSDILGWRRCLPLKQLYLL